MTDYPPDEIVNVILINIITITVIHITFSRKKIQKSHNDKGLTQRARSSRHPHYDENDAPILTEQLLLELVATHLESLISNAYLLLQRDLTKDTR